MSNSSPNERIEKLLADLTMAEKADLVVGLGFWDTRANERVGVPSMIVTDGPNGARGGGLMGTGTATACIPAGSVLGATWDPELVERLGQLLGDEAQAKSAQVLLAPTINLHRNPLGGRNFECYSEDPFLTGEIAVGFVRGVQSRGVATTAKHFVANDSEFERNTIDSQVDERTLREVYLAPFEAVVTKAEAWGIMSSYNRLNGTYASEHRWLLTTVLRDEWGFDGFVVSDWFAVRSTGESVKAGLSLEMPGPGRFYGAEAIGAALEAGEIDEAHLDAIALDVLRVLDRTGADRAEGNGEENALDRPDDRILIREASAAGTVLIRNDGVLPLDVGSLSSLAVIGPNAQTGKVMGGGSARVKAYRVRSPLESIQERWGGQLDVRYAQGCDIDRSTPGLRAPVLLDRHTIDYYAGLEHGGEILTSQELGITEILFAESPAPGVPSEFSARMTGMIQAEASGTHSLRLVQCGRAKVSLDGKVIIDATVGEIPRGDEFFGMASAELEADVELDADKPAELVIEFNSRDSTFIGGFRVGLVSMVERDLVAEAEELAAGCDAAVVVVGTNDDWETEGRDRDQFELPGEQAELIRRVAAVNNKTVVVVNTGGPHALDWLDAPNATLSVGFGGQEMGDALVDVLEGIVDPGGRMPNSTPARYEHSPAYLNYPGENSVVRYGEGVFIGHRWFDARHIAPAVPFGHGLSYASFSWSEPRTVADAATSVSSPITVEVDVTNTSDRSGSDVVQLYIAPPPSILHRPVRELKGFAKVHLDPGETTTITIQLDARSFAYFDPGDQLYEFLSSGAPVPAEGGQRHVEAGWYVEPGDYTIVIARSAADHVHTATLTLTGDEHRFAATHER